MDAKDRPTKVKYFTVAVIIIIHIRFCAIVWMM